jgi:hypothetical protein
VLTRRLAGRRVFLLARVTGRPCEQGAYQMDFFERCFLALAIVGSLGVIAVVIWILMR